MSTNIIHNYTNSNVVDPPPYDDNVPHDDNDSIPYYADTPQSSSSSWSNYIDHRFHITERNSTINTEIRSGIVTFVTMAYILIVNPAILSKASINSPHDPFPFTNIATATALSSCIGTWLCGWYGNLPFGLAPGMGLNSYFTYGICIKLGLSWHIGLTCCLVQGILFMILSITGACSMIQLYAPTAIKKSITIGLGLFQALIGFELMKLVVPGTDGTLLALGKLNDMSLWLSIFGLLVIATLLILDVKAAMLIGIITITVLSYLTGIQSIPAHYIQLPELSYTFIQYDFYGYWNNFATCFSITLVLLFVSVFDTAGVQFACGTAADLLDDNGHLPGSTAAFNSAAIATIVGSCLGTSPIIIHNETCAGIADGARTGLSGCIVSLCFLLSIPFIPILESVPSIASAAPLVIVGMLMMQMCVYIDWNRIDHALPAFLTASLIPFTYSIMNGMLAGFIAYMVLYCINSIKPYDTVDLISEEYTPAEPMTPSKLHELEAATPLLGLTTSPWKRSTGKRNISLNNKSTVQSPIIQHSYVGNEFLGIPNNNKHDTRQSYGSTYQNMLPVI